MSVWKSDETLLSICILNFSFKNDFVWEEISNIRHSVSSPDENTSKFVKNTPLRVVFSTLFSVFHLVMKHCISCLIYYLKGCYKAQGELTGACPAEQSMIELRNTFLLPTPSRFQSGMISKHQRSLKWRVTYRIGVHSVPGGVSCWHEKAIV